MFRIRLKQLREDAKYSQYGFAETFGVAQSTVGNWESGTREPNIETMEKLADFFNVTVDYLLGREEKNKKNTPDKIEMLGEKKYPEMILGSTGGLSEGNNEEYVGAVEKERDNLIRNILAARLDLRQIRELNSLVQIMENL